MVKHSKSKPGSPTEPVSTNVTRVQDNTSETSMTDQEMNKPFTLVLSVPHDEGISAVFPHVMIETSIFPVDRENDTMHAFIVDKITDMTCEAMKAYFTVTNKIQDGIQCLVQDNYKCDATGKEHFRFLISQCPSNYNVAVTFAAACQQCLCLDSLSGRFIWVCPPNKFIGHLLDLVCFALKDYPNNEFFNKAYPFLPTDICGAFQLYKQSGVVEKRRFSNTLHQGMHNKWHSSIAISLLSNPATLVTVQD